ncbi:MAG: alpha/beta fold hydrolase [Nitrospirae bacterium]|nr:MAG: alpha/beta fold hydrolase [Nitrospirota bacterium]
MFLLLPLLVTACMTVPDIPPWFDSFQRRSVKTVTVQGHRTAYLDEGQGPPVILVHGFGGSMWQWEYQQEAFAGSHRLITLDLLGSGLSDKPDQAYGPDDMVGFFTAFMDALDLPRASLVGNSMGGGLVIGMALAHPERVDRLVLISGLPDHVREKLTGRLIKQALETSAPVWLIRLGNWLLGRGVTEAVLQEIVYDHSRLTPAVLDRAYRNRRRPGLIPPLMAQARALPLWEEGFATHLRDIGRPTLIIWGAEDEVFPPQVGRDMASVIPSSTFELLPKAGHIPQWERPDLVNPLLLRFLQ